MAYKPNNRPRNDWVRKSNCPGGAGTQPGNKYNFSSYLKKVGDFVITHRMPRKDMLKIFYAAHIWAYRHHCRIETERYFYPNDEVELRIEIISATRRNGEYDRRVGRRRAGK
jgi:hypothetical protein